MKITKNNILDFVLVICIGLIVCLGTLVSYGSLGLDYYIKNEFILSILILVMVAFRDRISLFTISKKGFLLALMFFALLSEIINGRSHVINLLLMAFFILTAIRLSEQSYKILIAASIVAQLIFFFQYKLEGYFNSYALTTALIGIEMMLLLYISGKKRLYLFIAIYLLFFGVLFLMASRTSLLAFMISGGLLILGFIGKMERNKYITLLLIIVLVIFFAWKYYDSIYNLFINKWTNLGYSTDDLSSGRFAMWKDVIFNQESILGHSENFINDKYLHEDLHNIFVQVLGKYGILCFAFFVVWFIDLIKRIISLSVIYKVYFVSFFSFYFISGMTENVLFLDCKVFMIVYCFCVNLAWVYKVSDWEKIKRKT